MRCPYCGNAFFQIDRTTHIKWKKGVYQPHCNEEIEELERYIEEA